MALRATVACTSINTYYIINQYHQGLTRLSYMYLHLTLPHSLTHSITQSLTQSLNHSLNHSLTQSLNHSLNHSLTQSLNHSLNLSITHLVALTATVACTSINTYYIINQYHQGLLISSRTDKTFVHVFTLDFTSLTYGHVSTEN